MDDRRVNVLDIIKECNRILDEAKIDFPDEKTKAAFDYNHNFLINYIDFMKNAADQGCPPPEVVQLKKNS
ncbi:MAG: hypothetical protein ABFR75_04535 [Acidobacteriota bacterium]